MKRLALIQFLQQHNCELLREGARHSVWINRSGNQTSVVPRHREIKDLLARKICKDLEIPDIKNP